MTKFFPGQTDNILLLVFRFIYIYIEIIVDCIFSETLNFYFLSMLKNNKKNKIKNKLYSSSEKVGFCLNDWPSGLKRRYLPN